MRRLILLLLLISAGPAMANCWRSAGERYGIEPELLQAIATVESGLYSSAINENNNGSTDIGLMQINSQHFRQLKKYNITQGALINDPCQNIMAGAWVLAGHMRMFGYSWEAVGAYNAGDRRDGKTEMWRKRYIQKVAPVYQRLKNKHKDEALWAKRTAGK